MARGRVSYSRRPSRHAAHSNLEVISEEDGYSSSSGRRTPTTSPALGGHSPSSRRRALSQGASSAKKAKRISPQQQAQRKAQRIVAWMTQRLASAFTRYLAEAGGSIPFSGEGLGAFFTTNHESKKLVENNPTVLGQMLATTAGLTVVVGPEGQRLITLTPA